MYAPLFVTNRMIRTNNENRTTNSLEFSSIFAHPCQMEKQQQEEQAKGFRLKKGTLGVGTPLTLEQLEVVRIKRWDADKKLWALRDKPLTDEELECWNYQARWLKCPITGNLHLFLLVVPFPFFFCPILVPTFSFMSPFFRPLIPFLLCRLLVTPFPFYLCLSSFFHFVFHFFFIRKAVGSKDDFNSLHFVFYSNFSKGKGWLDPKTILGVGIYHAPRFLSDAEKQRKELDDLVAGEQNNVERKKKMRAGEAVDWESDFLVYPSVLPPPATNIDENLVVPHDVRCGYMEILTGPCFDVSAYNQGESVFFNFLNSYFFFRYSRKP